MPGELPILGFPEAQGTHRCKAIHARRRRVITGKISSPNGLQRAWSISHQALEPAKSAWGIAELSFDGEVLENQATVGHVADLEGLFIRCSAFAC
jgi:hypothetical protein